MTILWAMQSYSTKGWVYRDEQGWVFAKLTPDELVEFKSYEQGITIPRMRIRLPYSQPISFYEPELNELNRLDNFNLANWFACCTIPQAHPLVLSRFRLHQKTCDKPTRYPVEPGGYETGLWADEVNFCRGVGCEITIHYAWGWEEWGVPVEWKTPSTKPPPHRRPRSAEYTFIYALIDELTQEVGYVGRSDDPEHRLLDHLRETDNPVKWTWIQSLRVQGRKPKLMILEKVAVAEEDKQEQYWISYYRKHGHNLTNDVCQKRVVYWQRH